MQEKNWQLNLRNALQQMIDTELTSVPLVHIKILLQELCVLLMNILKI